jgi:hypothetical protein
MQTGDWVKKSLREAFHRSFSGGKRVQMDAMVGTMLS